MQGPLTRINFFNAARDFKVPVLVIQGAEDDIGPAELAQAYVEAIHAPQKRFIAIAGAGHSVCVIAAGQVLEDLVRCAPPRGRRAAVGRLPVAILRRAGASRHAHGLHGTAPGLTGRRHASGGAGGAIPGSRSRPCPSGRRHSI